MSSLILPIMITATAGFGFGLWLSNKIHQRLVRDYREKRDEAFEERDEAFGERDEANSKRDFANSCADGWLESLQKKEDALDKLTELSTGYIKQIHDAKHAAATDGEFFRGVAELVEIFTKIKVAGENIISVKVEVKTDGNGDVEFSAGGKPDGPGTTC
jgi:hypothetical protein